MTDGGTSDLHCSVSFDDIRENIFDTIEIALYIKKQIPSSVRAGVSVRPDAHVGDIHSLLGYQGLEFFFVPVAKLTVTRRMCAILRKIPLSFNHRCFYSSWQIVLPFCFHRVTYRIQEQGDFILSEIKDFLSRAMSVSCHPY